MFGAAFGLTMALRAFCGVPMLATTISTVPSGSSRDTALPMALSFAAASSTEMPGAKRT